MKNAWTEQREKELASIGCLDIAQECGNTELKYPLDRALENIITQDTELIKIKDLAKKFARFDIPVLITGETGTGKELFARALHGNRKGDFVAVNCGGIPETLIESEFFGSKSGAYTGSNNRAGYFEEAMDGTLFLDEIAELDRNLQSKLLRVIQDKKIRRLGSTQEIPINCRIVSATNYSPEELATNNKLFRQDLFFRLAGTKLHLKPLHERNGDIILIAEMLINRIGYDWPEDIKETLLNHKWPGNIRELINFVTELVILDKLPGININDTAICNI